MDADRLLSQASCPRLSRKGGLIADNDINPGDKLKTGLSIETVASRWFTMLLKIPAIL